MSGTNSAYAKLPLGVYVIAGAAALLGSLSANPLLSVVAIISLISFIKLLWRGVGYCQKQQEFEACSSRNRDGSM